MRDPAHPGSGARNTGDNPPHPACPVAAMVALLAVVALMRTASCQVPDSLRAWIREGLSNNLELRQERLSAEKGRGLVAQARGAFLPSVVGEAGITEMSRNNTDIGKRLNPYSDSLNNALNKRVFPADIEYRLRLKGEAKVRITQPLFTPGAYFNYRLQRAHQSGRLENVAMAERRLAAEIKSLYVDYSRATGQLRIEEGMVQLAEEEVRIGEALYGNGKATADMVMRAKAGLGDIRQRRNARELERNYLREYFNFTLNRPPDRPITLIPDSLLGIRMDTNLDGAIAAAMQGRKELRKIRYDTDASKAEFRLAGSAFLPNLYFNLDYGYQESRYNTRYKGSEVDFREKQKPLGLSLLMQWNLFSGFQDVSKARVALLEGRRLEAKAQEFRARLALKVRRAYEEAVEAGESLEVVSELVAGNAKTLSMVEAKAREGACPPLEMVMARKEMAEAECRLLQAKCGYGLKIVALENEAALDAAGEK